MWHALWEIQFFFGANSASPSPSSPAWSRGTPHSAHSQLGCTRQHWDLYPRGPQKSMFPLIEFRGHPGRKGSGNAQGTQFRIPKGLPPPPPTPQLHTAPSAWTTQPSLSRTDFLLQTEGKDSLLWPPGTLPPQWVCVKLFGLGSGSPYLCHWCPQRGHN